jgi:hypothetical protein
MMKKILFNKISWLTLTIILTACGGGGSGSSEVSITDNSYVKNTISGNAVKGPINGAEVILVYFSASGQEIELPATNAPVQTNPDGSFEFSFSEEYVPDNVGPAVLRTIGGTTGTDYGPAPMLESVIPDLAVALASNAIIDNHLSAASSVAAKLLKMAAQQSQANPGAETARSVMALVEANFDLELKDDPNEEESSTASLNYAFDELLGLESSSANNVAVNELVLFLAANLASSSGQLDDNMQDPNNSNLDIPASLISLGEDNLANMFPSGPDQILQRVQLRSERGIIDTVGPSIVNGIASSNTQVLVTFSEPLKVAEINNLNNYILTAIGVDGLQSNSGRVGIIDASFLDDNYLTLVLTTEPQSNTRYILQLTGLYDLAGNPFQVPENGIEGIAPSTVTIDGVPPTGSGLITGNAVKGPINGAEVILVYFSASGQEIELPATNAPVQTNPDGSYEFSLRQVYVPDNVGPAVLRTIGGTTGTDYGPAPMLESVIPDLAAALASNAIIDNHLSAASSVAAKLLKMAAQQSQANPGAETARSVMALVEANFDLELKDDPNEEESSTASLNYAFDELLGLKSSSANNVAVNELVLFLAANLASSSGQLDDNMQDPNNSNLDLPASLISLGEDNLANMFPSGPDQIVQRVQLRSERGIIDTVGPSVVSGIASGNTQILITFSEPLRVAEITNLNNYIMTAVDVDSQRSNSGRVRITNATFLDDNYLTLVLTTQSQSDIRYILQLTGLYDLAGNPFQVPEKGLEGIDPSTVTIDGVPPTGDEIIDSDGDGLSDSDELVGWEVVTTTAAGNESRYTVSSDPMNPDTDGDGVTDNEEKHAAADPRSADTDGDTLSDNMEWNVIYSDPTNQDTDGDGTQDGFEFYSFRTSPVLADTDGDQISDTDEVLGRNRNPRIADIPQAGISVGEVRLQIDERFTYEDVQGETVSIESSSSSSLSQSENTSFATSNTDVTEAVSGFRAETGFEGGGGRGTAFLNGAFLNIEGSYQNTSSNAFTSDTATAIESQRVHEQSLNKSREINTTSTVTREVFGASIDVDLTIKNIGDLSFAISNLEITVLQQDRQASNRFVPVATLIANSTLITGNPTTFNLGPLTPERGPILFSSRDVFPNLVEKLMKSPSGLIFKVANFDMTDESGRIYTFANQIARDRTAGIIVDSGDGEAQQNLVSTALQPDVNRFGGPASEFVGGFNADGSPKGIPLDFALQDILNQKKNADLVDGIMAGPNQEAQSIAQGDDVQLIPSGTTGVGVGSIVISAGEDGVLDSSPTGDDEKGVTTGYETSLTCNVSSDNAREICTDDSDCTGSGFCSGPEILVRFGSLRNGDFNRAWVVLTTREIPAGADFGQVTLKPGADIFFAFVQDLDQDGLFAREEYMSGSTDSRADVFVNDMFGEHFDENLALGSDRVPDSRDTDRDGLGDFSEIRVGWKVAVDGGLLRQVFSSPRLRDSDGDKLQDPVERDLRRYCIETDDGVDFRSDGLCAFQGAPVKQDDAVAIIAGPNGIADSISNAGDEQLEPPGKGGLSYSTPVIGVGTVPGIQSALALGGDDLYESLNNIPPATDPSVADTDMDSVSDFDEVVGFDIGLSIIDGGNEIAESGANGDDVQKAVETNPVKPGGIIILPGLNGIIDSFFGGDDIEQDAKSVKTDPLRRDTDGDLVADGRELEQGGDPTDSSDAGDFRDSDQDGLSDSEEANLGWGVSVNGESIIIVKSNPSLPDSDLDGLPDLIERDIRTNPNNADTDGDGLSDFDEFSDFGQFFGLEQQFPGFFVNGSTSQQYGTEPFSTDTDKDGLDDNVELLEGYRVLLAGESSFREIFTNPLVDDTDFDGRTDREERDRPFPTDATDPDTDGDGRTDGQEFISGSDPLVRDIAVEIKMLRVIVSTTQGDGANGDAEMTWWFTTQGPSDSAPVLLTSPFRAHHTDILDRRRVWTGSTCWNYLITPNYTWNINLVNSSRTVILREGQSFTLNGIIGEIDDVSQDCNKPPYYVPTYLWDVQGCVASVNESFTFDDFISDPRGEIRTAAVNGNCEFEVEYTVEIK